MKLGLSLIALAFVITGCATSPKQDPVTPTPLKKKQGLVHGGQQPVTGATVQLYAVGTTGDGSAATPLLSPATASDANGNFTLSNFVCPSPTALVYLVATGGNPGLFRGTNNSDLALMAAVGPCNSLTSSTFIVVNELTTVAAVYALAPFIASPTAIGSSASDASNLAAAFSLAAQYVNVNTGSAPGTNIPAGSTVPVTQLNTIANILASCINSTGGVAGDNSACGNLFSLTAIGPTVTDTITATLNLANFAPQLDTQSLFNLVSSIAPFQPALAFAPPNFSVGFVPPPSLVLSSSEVTFPTTVVGFQATQTLTLTNVGQTPVIGVSVNVTAGTDFVQTNDCPVTLAPSSSCSIQVSFTPTALGARSSTLSISEEASSLGPFIVAPISGDGSRGTTVGPITVSPSQLNFTLVNVPQTVTLTNQGSTPLAIGTISVTASSLVGAYNGAAFTQTNTCGGVLDAQSICTISVSAAGLYTSIPGTLTINDDSVDGPQTVSLQTTSGVEITQSSFSFGDWALGVTAPSQTIAASNPTSNGLVTVEFAVASITGPAASDFSVTSAGCFQPYYCNAIVTFTPSAVGPRTATLVTNIGNILVSGTGIPTGPSFTYSWQGLGALVNLTNNGSTSLQLTASVTGMNAGDFTIKQCSSPLAPAASCTINVSYNPTTLGTFSDFLTITDSLSGTQQTTPFASESTPPPPVVTPSSLNFGNVQVGAASAEKTVSVTAPAGDHIVATVLAAPSANYTITQGSTCASSPCIVSLTMSPTTNSCCINSTLRITDLANPRNWVDVPLTGIGGVPVVSLSSSGLSFPVRAVGSTSIAQTVTLSNTGNANLTISGISLSGADPTDFIQSNNCGSSLIPNGSCTFTVSFSPTAVGDRTAYIQILSNATSSPDQIQLMGTAQ